MTIALSGINLTGTAKFGPYTAPAPSDPYYSNVSLLLHADGTSGSTVFTDNSPSPKTITHVGNTNINTTTKKFGTGSILFDGSNDYLGVAAVSGLGPADFTIEYWVMPTSLYNYIAMVSAWPIGPSGWHCATQAAGQVVFYANGAELARTTTALVVNEWTHVAFVRNAGVLKIYLNGVQSGTTANVTTLWTSSIFDIGARDGGAEGFMGYMDDIRITPGVARYTSNFAVPTEAFPNQ